MWPPRLPPLPEMSEEVRQKKLAEARKKVKGAESWLPDLAQGPLTAGPWSESVLPLEALGARPWAPLGVPPKVFSPAPPPHPRQPSSRPRWSAPGDFGLVTPEVPGSRLGPRLLPPRTGPPGLPGLPGLPISRDRIRALRSLPPARSGDSGVGWEEWNVIMSQSPWKLSLSP